MALVALGQLDRLAVDEDPGFLEPVVGRPACHGQQDGIERFVGAFVDTNLPALAFERDEIGADERDKIA